MPGCKGSISWRNVMSTADREAKGFRLPLVQGVLPIKGSQIQVEIVAGLTLAALAIPEVMGYTKI